MIQSLPKCDSCDLPATHFFAAVQAGQVKSRPCSSKRFCDRHAAEYDLERNASKCTSLMHAINQREQQGKPSQQLSIAIRCPTEAVADAVQHDIEDLCDIVEIERRGAMPELWWTQLTPDASRRDAWAAELLANVQQHAVQWSGWGVK